MFDLLVFISGTAALMSLLVITIRYFGKERVKLGRFQLSLNKASGIKGEAFTRQDGMKAIAWGIGALCLAYGVSLIYCGIFENEVSPELFVSAWKKYDAYHYLGIAEHGYAGYTEGGIPFFLVFFPLYPWLIRLLHFIIPNYAACGFIISGLSYVAACYVFARLMSEEFGRKASRLGLAFLSAYPFAFFFSSLHTESLFLLLSVTSFYFIRKRRYPIAGVFGALAALTRMQGLFLALIAFAEYCSSERPVQKLKSRDWRGLWQDIYGKLFWMAFIGLGALIYLLLNNAVTGDAFSFMTFQKMRWHQGFMPFTESLPGLWRVMLNPSDVFVSFTTWGPQVVMFFFCIAVLFYGASRLPPAWTLYFIVCIFLNISLSNPLSFCRYIACAFPLPAALSIGGLERPLAVKFALAAFGILQGVYMLAYFAGKHIC